MARQRGLGLHLRHVAEESLGFERGRPAAPGLAAMAAGGRDASELWWGRKAGKLVLSPEEGWKVRASGVGW